MGFRYHDEPRGHLHHDTVGAGFGSERIGQARGRGDALHAHERHLEGHLPQGGLGDGADEGHLTLAEGATRHHDIDAAGSGEFGRDVVRVGDNGQLASVEEALGHAGHGGPAADEDRGALGDLFGGPPCEGHLGGRVLTSA